MLLIKLLIFSDSSRSICYKRRSTSYLLTAFIGSSSKSTIPNLDFMSKLASLNLSMLSRLATGGSLIEMLFWARRWEFLTTMGWYGSIACIFFSFLIFWSSLSLKYWSFRDYFYFFRVSSSAVISDSSFPLTGLILKEYLRSDLSILKSSFSSEWNGLCSNLFFSCLDWIFATKASNLNYEGTFNFWMTI